METGRPLVFGVGLSRTGTTSLTEALDLLGWRCVHYPDPALMLAGEYARALNGYDAATDITVAAFFRELDEAFPGARFVLTVRDEREWLASVIAHTERVLAGRPEERGAEHPKSVVRVRCLGTHRVDELLFIESYRAHNEAVREHFENRPGALLEMDVTRERGWGRLCAFLGVDAPGEAFPHRNRSPWAA